MQPHTLEIVAVGTLPDTLQATSHTKTAPQFLQASADKWTHRQTLTNEYDVHKRSTGIDPFAQQAVSGMNISRFVQPSSWTSHPDSPPEDLNYSLRRFVTVDPVHNANVVYTRIAIKEGRTMAGYVPALPQPRRVAKNEEYFASETAEGDSEVFGKQ